MRKLNFEDLTNACQLLKRIGFKDAIKAAPDGSISGGEDLLWLIIDCCGSDRIGELFRFLAGPLEMSAEDVKKLELSEISAAFEELAAMNDLRGFFAKLAARMRRG